MGSGAPRLDLLRQGGRVVSTDYAWGSEGCVQIWESKRTGWAGPRTGWASKEEHGAGQGVGE